MRLVEDLLRELAERETGNAKRDSLNVKLKSRNGNRSRHLQWDITLLRTGCVDSSLFSSLLY